MHKPGWMATERAPQIRDKAEEAVAQEMQWLQESGAEAKRLIGFDQPRQNQQVLSPTVVAPPHPTRQVP